MDQIHPDAAVERLEATAGQRKIGEACYSAPWNHSIVDGTRITRVRPHQGVFQVLETFDGTAWEEYAECTNEDHAITVMWKRAAQSAQEQSAGAWIARFKALPPDQQAEVLESIR